MRGWIILGAILLALFLLGQIRVGVQAEYSQNGPAVWIRVGALHGKVLPRKKKQKKKKKKPKPKKQKPPKKKKPAPPKPDEPPQSKAGGALELVRQFLPLILQAAGSFKRKLQVDVLRLEMTAGAKDPADAALLYGRANAALGAIWHPLTRAFHVKDGHAHTQIDFDRDKMVLYAYASLSLKVGQILWLGLHFGVRALVRLVRYRRTRRQQRKVVSRHDGKE